MEEIVIATICVGMATFAAWAGYRGRRKLKLTSLLVLVLLITWLLSIANFAVGIGFVSYGLYGGTPENGKIQNGKYYVGNHGEYREVSEQFYHNDLIYDTISEDTAMATTFAMIPVSLYYCGRSNKLKGTRPFI